MAALWWVWVAAGLALALGELAIPGYVLLGTALGAMATGAMLWAGLWPAGWIAAGLPNALLFTALVSLVAWLVLRRLAGIRKGQVKYWDRDINED